MVRAEKFLREALWNRAFGGLTVTPPCHTGLMQPNTRTPPHAAELAAEQARARADLKALLDRLATAEQAMAEAVELAGRVAGSGAAEREYGLPVELLLGVRGGLVGMDRDTLLTTAEVLATMPMLAAASAGGRVTYGFVRSVRDGDAAPGARRPGGRGRRRRPGAGKGRR